MLVLNTRSFALFAGLCQRTTSLCHPFRTLCNSVRSASFHHSKSESVAMASPQGLSAGVGVCEVKVVSWNMDGLDPRQITERASAVCDILEAERADVALLQEVVHESLDVLSTHFSATFEIYAPSADRVGYFVVLLIRSSTFKVEDGSFSEFDFMQSTQGRSLLQAKDIVHKESGHRFAFLTSHLESLKKKSKVRMKQLKETFLSMNTLTKVDGCTVLFGGDTNLRDAEVEAIPMPEGVCNVWEKCGRPEESRYPFDLKRNDNLSLWEVQTQYDKMFLSLGAGVIPSGFHLVGTSRLSFGLFPSDHFGIACTLSWKRVP